MKTTFALTLSMLIVALPAAPAFAQQAAPRAAVAYSDLDLSRPSERQVLEKRIAAAADQVCPARPAPAELAKMRIYTKCRDQALAGTSHQLATAYAQHELAPATVRLAADHR